MDHSNDPSENKRELNAPHAQPPNAYTHSRHDGDRDIERLSSQLREAGHSLYLETEKRSALEEALRMQNRALARTLTSLVLKESDSAKFLDPLLEAITHELNVHSCAVWSIDSRTALATLEKTAFNGKILSGLAQLKHPQAGRAGKVKSRLFARAVTAGPLQIDDVWRTPLLEPALRRWFKSQKVKSLLCVPLKVGKKMTGVLSIRIANPGDILGSKTHLVYALSNWVSLAIRLDGMLERKQETATLRERGRLASELHDSISQNLSAAALQLEAADSELPPGAGKAHSHLGLALNIVRQSQEELRRSIWALRPLPLEGHTLPEALGELSTRLSEHMSLGAEFVLGGKPCALSEELDTNLLRIAQEAIHNAIRHASATQIKIQLAYSVRRIVLAVRDNGVGFKTGAARFRHGAGLVNMRERTARIGAKFSIHSWRSRGTEVTVLLPFPAA